MSRRLWLAVSAGAVMLSVTACNSEPVYTSSGVEIEGTVTLDGKPLDVGMVLVAPGNAMTGGGSAAGSIAPGGTFMISDAPVGVIRLAVRTSHMKSMAKAGKLPTKAGISGAPQIEGAFRDVPKHYESPETSKLQATISKGKNTVNLELKSK